MHPRFLIDDLLQWLILRAQFRSSGIDCETCAQLRRCFRIYLCGIRVSRFCEYEQSGDSGRDVWFHANAVGKSEVRKAAVHYAVFVRCSESLVSDDRKSEKCSRVPGVCRSPLLATLGPDDPASVLLALVSRKCWLARMHGHVRTTTLPKLTIMVFQMLDMIFVYVSGRSFSCSDFGLSSILAIVATLWINAGS